MKRRFSLPAPWMTAGAYLLTLAALAGLIWAPAALLKGQDAGLYGRPLTVEPAQGALTEEGRAYPLAQTMYDRTHVWSEQWLQWEDAGMNEAAAREALTDALDKLAEADVLDAQLTARYHDALSHAAQYAAGRDGMGFLDLRWTLFATKDGEILDPAKARDTQEQIFTAAYFLSATVEPRTGVPVALTLYLPGQASSGDAEATLLRYRQVLGLQTVDDWQAVDISRSGTLEAAAAYSPTTQLYVYCSLPAGDAATSCTLGLSSMSPDQFEQFQ